LQGTCFTVDLGGGELNLTVKPLTMPEEKNSNELISPTINPLISIDSSKYTLTQNFNITSTPEEKNSNELISPTINPLISIDSSKYNLTQNFNITSTQRQLPDPEIFKKLEIIYQKKVAENKLDHQSLLQDLFNSNNSQKTNNLFSI